MAVVCVYCSSSETVDERYRALAREVGAALAARGHTLVSGGGSVGCMGEVARAARAAGARTVGVIPEALLAWEVYDRDADELVVTPGMRERKAEMDRRSDAFLALPGGIGTLEELVEVWTARSLGLHAKPVVVLDPWDDLRPLHDLVAGLVARGFVAAEAAAEAVWTRDVDEALARVATPPSPAGVPSGLVGHRRAVEALEAD